MDELKAWLQQKLEGRLYKKLTEENINALHQAGYDKDLLGLASRESLLDLKLPLAIVDMLLAKCGAAAGPGSQSTGAGGATSVEGAAAGPGPGSAAAAGVDPALVRQVAREAALAVIESAMGPRKPKSFSSVNNTEAIQLLGALGVHEICGNDMYAEELQIPVGTATCSTFEFKPYSNEDAATAPLLTHHQAQLELLKVPFGRGAFKVYDVRSNGADLLLVRHGNVAFRGIFDGCVAPFGLVPSSSLTQCRIVYEHKMPQNLRTDNAHKGQAIVELLAAYAYGPCPVLLDLTDGTKHHVYTIRGKQLIVWAGLSPTQAYYLQARHLQTHPSRAYLELELEQIPEEEQAWMRPLHQLRPVSGLQEQLESVIPFLPPDERMPAALELIHAWAQAQPEQLPLPASIQAFYA